MVSGSSSTDIVVDAGAVQGELPRLWASVGFDELNWTYTPRGRDLLGRLAEAENGPYLVRSHNMFTSGTGMGLPHWSAGNVYHEREDGSAWHDFQVLDRAYDAVVEAGHVPIVELGFTPRALIPDDAEGRLEFAPGPSQYTIYEAGAWSFPPRDLGRWAALVAATAEHYRARYGSARVAEWRWEVWNEPDIAYWRGTRQAYFELYRASAAAVREVIPGALVGGPATTGDLRRQPGLPAHGPSFLADFLDFCVAEAQPLDFVSFHTKGAYFFPVRSYLPPGRLSEPQSPSMVKMLREIRASLAEVAKRPSLAGTECLADECDASVPAHLGRFDNSNFAYRNSEYFPVFQCALMKKLLDIEEPGTPPLRAATAWAFYMEGERCFEGTRSLVTYGDVPKPVLNAYRMLGRLGRWRLRAWCNDAWPISRVDEDEHVPEEVDVLAARGEDNRVGALVWRRCDDQYAAGTAHRPVRIGFRGLGPDALTVREWRVDAHHSNSYRAWEALGAPDYPLPIQMAEMKRQGRLSLSSPERREVPEAGELTVGIELPLPAVSLLELVPGGGPGQ